MPEVKYDLACLDCIKKKQTKTKNMDEDVLKVLFCVWLVGFFSPYKKVKGICLCELVAYSGGKKKGKQTMD